MVTAITAAVVVVAAGAVVFGHAIVPTRNMHLAGLRISSSDSCRHCLQRCYRQGDSQPECGQGFKHKLHGVHNVKVYRHQYNMYESLRRDWYDAGGGCWFKIT